MSDSYVEVSPSTGTAFVGSDAVSLFRVTTLRSGIRMHGKFGMIPTRGMTITKMLALATQITGKPYKGKAKHDAAIADLTAHIDALTCAMPIIVKA